MSFKALRVARHRSLTPIGIPPLRGNDKKADFSASPAAPYGCSETEIAGVASSRKEKRRTVKCGVSIRDRVKRY